MWEQKKHSKKKNRKYVTVVTWEVKNMNLMSEIHQVQKIFLIPGLFKLPKSFTVKIMTIILDISSFSVPFPRALVPLVVKKCCSRSLNPPGMPRFMCNVSQRLDCPLKDTVINALCVTARRWHSPPESIWLSRYVLASQSHKPALQLSALCSA